MMSLVKKMPKVLVIIVLVFAAAACSSSPNTATENQTETSNQSTNADQSTVTVQASWMYEWWKPKEWGNDPVTKVLTEKTGVQFKFNGISGDGNEKASVMLLAKDYPEVMWMDRGPVLDKYIAAGALYSIDELAEKYNFPDITSNYIPESAINALKKPDGHFYGIPNWFNEAGEFAVGGAFNIRADLYSQLGSPEIKTIDDLTNFLRKVKESNLKYDGKAMYPIGFQGITGNVERLANLWGSQNASGRYYDANEDTVKHYLRNETTLSALKWLNMLYKEKLLDPENFTYKSEQFDEAAAKGKFAIILANFWDLWKASEVLKLSNPDSYYKVIPHPAGTAGVQPNGDGYNTAGWNVAVITKNAKNPEKIMEFFNYYLSPEGQILSFYGIEGETWENVGGKPMLKPGVYEEIVKDAEGFGKKTGVRYLDLNQYQKYNWERDAESEDRKADRAIIESVNFDATQLSILTLDGESKEGIAYANISASLETELTQIIMAASGDEVAAKYDDLIKRLDKQGLKSIEDAWTVLYKEKNK
ncbi:extracellular solute-binding protein [Paenibacillus prosopidis]|uniref:Putative aldouronate transport system substrate-binding protein n=1 Tax=Paenibacillus prosopidis TaxID=630520 RepID=A0A368VNF3_9BACL|nr:extracellular solute-binding protein [Paenibacillus prosopidis]RCW43058.1 putative aldouronate transport system substrate-binding protein [Paenibacillus prosopidis]